MQEPIFINKELNRFLRNIKGTTTLGVKGKNFVVLAADRRATAGTFIAHKKAKKIIKISDNIAATIAGLVADTQILAKYAKAISGLYSLEKLRKPPVRTVAKLLSNIMFASRPNIFIAQFLLGGVDYKGTQLFNVELFGSIQPEKYVATGSGSPIAIGILEKSYREDIPLNEAKKLSVKALTAAISRDSATGDGLDVAVISEEGVNFLSEEEIKKLIENSS